MTIRIPFLLATLATGELFAQTGTSDCAGAVQLCGGVFTETHAPSGSGSVYEFTGACNAGLETASLWYTFTVQADGNLNFILDPAVAGDDYDWGLFNITNGGCAGITLQNGSSPQVGCNSYGSFFTNGATGISTAHGGTGVSNGPGDLNGPPFNADLPVVAGQTYALVVMNWTNSPDGYNIDFTGSTASLYDSGAPEIASVVPDCTNEVFEVTFSEHVMTSTVEPADFNFTTPAGLTVDVVTVTPVDPGASAQASYHITTAAPLVTAGTYTLHITGASGSVEDPCGNAVINTSFTVELTTPLVVDLLGSTACNGANGSIHATNVSGGTGPVQFNWGGQAMPNGTATGLAPGTYTINISDAAGCALQRAVVVPDHVLQVTIDPDQDSLSCAVANVLVQRISLEPSQEVNYTWAVLNNGGWGTIGSGPVLEVGVEGAYRLIATEPVSGCSDTAQVYIHTSEVADLDLSSLAFPNVVSPNGDGHNDTWHPFLQDDPDMDVTMVFTAYDLRIYDRWGSEVFASKDGTLRTWNPRNAVDGTYFYTMALRADCGSAFERKATGTITVLH